MTSTPSKKDVGTAAFPWWMSVLLALASYILLKHVAPDFLQSTGYSGWAGFLAYLAPLVTIAFLLLAATQLYADDTREQSPPESRSGLGDGAAPRDPEKE